MFESDFNPTFAYSTNGSVVFNGKGYTSLQNNNTGHAPDKSPAFWKLSDVVPANAKFPAGDPRNVAGPFPAGDPRNVNPAGPNYDARLDPKNPKFDAAFAAKPRSVGPHNNPNYDARLDPKSPSYDPAVRDRAGVGGVGDRAGADYRNAASEAEWHATNHTHDGSPFPGNQGRGPYTRHNPDGYAPPFSEPKPRREITEQEKVELEARKAAYEKRTNGTA